MTIEYNEDKTFKWSGSKETYNTRKEAVDAAKEFYANNTKAAKARRVEKQKQYIKDNKSKVLPKKVKSRLIKSKSMMRTF